MPVIRALDDLKAPYPNPVLTIGNFDGVHLGHQALFNLVKERARAIDGTSMVLTFEPHPMRVLSKDHNGPPLITLHEQRIELIERLGIDVVICLEFTLALAAIEPEDFVLDILVGRIGVKEIVIGYDYTFGRRARGNRDLLIAMGKELGFIVHTVKAQPGRNGAIVSSTLIRELVSDGQVDKAPALLGRYYRIAGRVIHGHERGKKLGFPTANLRLVDELVPKRGVYAVRVTHQGRFYDGVANIGYNPTFGDVGLSVEVHCFDFDEDIYDQDIKVDFVSRLRDEKKFSGVDELISQISQDCQLARSILKEAS